MGFSLGTFREKYYVGCWAKIQISTVSLNGVTFSDHSFLKSKKQGSFRESPSMTLVVNFVVLGRLK